MAGEMTDFKSAGPHVTRATGAQSLGTYVDNNHHVAGKDMCNHHVPPWELKSSH